MKTLLNYMKNADLKSENDFKKELVTRFFDDNLTNEEIYYGMLILPDNGTKEIKEFSCYSWVRFSKYIAKPYFYKNAQYDFKPNAGVKPL